MNGNIPVLHFDNGEMSKRELQARLCSSMSGVPVHLLKPASGDEGARSCKS